MPKNRGSTKEPIQEIRSTKIVRSTREPNTVLVIINQARKSKSKNCIKWRSKDASSFLSWRKCAGYHLKVHKIIVPLTSVVVEEAFHRMLMRRNWWGCQHQVQYYLGSFFRELRDECVGTRVQGQDTCLAAR